MAAPTLTAKMRELLLQEELAARAATLTDEQRKNARDHLERARARHIAGEALALHDAHAEAARALREAIDASLAAAEIVNTPDLAAPIAGARAAAAELDKVSRQAFITDAKRAHQVLYEAVAPYSLDTRSLRRAQIRRAGAIVGYAIAAVCLVVWFLRRPTTMSAEASGSYNATFFPSRALDGDITSEWLLPDRTSGWIDIEISPPRAVHVVRLMNARNVPYNDRATNQFRVESSFKGAPLFGVDDAFAGFSTQPVWREIRMDGQVVDHIKVIVRSWHESGAGFAEITIE